MQRTKLLMVPGQGRILRTPGPGERGSAFLMCLTLVMIMTLLGVALFEMSAIEANLAKSDVSDMQAFYCAEAEVARLYGLYERRTPEQVSQMWTPGPRPIPITPLILGNVRYVVSGSAVVDAANRVVMVTVTCTLPNGRTRTVERNGTRDFANEIYRYSLVTGGVQNFFADTVLGGEGSPVLIGGSLVGGADTINGDIYVAGNVHVRGQARVNGYGTADPATITVAAGKNVTSSSSGFKAEAAGATAQGQIAPLPILSNAEKTGVIDNIRAAVTNKDGSQKMTGLYQEATVYNLGEIFNQLGSANEGNAERNLARPKGCTFGVASGDPKCQVWQDLVIIGPKRVQSATDKPSYIFMGLPRSPSLSPQGTSFNAIYAAAVTASPELRQLGFTTYYPSLGWTLDALLGANPDGEGRVGRLVDLSTGTDPSTGKSTQRAQPPIFYIDGYWLADGSSSGFAYNGRATIIASKSVVFADNVLYLGSLSNVNGILPSPSACPNGTTDRANCGLADMLGIIAQEDIWTGDPDGRIYEVSAVMLAGRDVNLVQYATADTCCRASSNPLTFNGTLLAMRGTALARDWANPALGSEGVVCSAAQPPCRPITFVKGDTSCGDLSGCWRFLSKNPATGLFAVDAALAAFRECVPTQADPVCRSGAKRVTHFQLNINYDSRLQTNPELIPPGLPTGGDMVYSKLAPGRWKDCGSNPSCS